jgi:hypothetical protein
MRSAASWWRSAGAGREPQGSFVLDVGTGSADIPAAIRQGQRHVAAKIFAIEADPVTARIAVIEPSSTLKSTLFKATPARRHLRRAFDFVVASQFLHHFSEAKILDLLKQWAVCQARHRHQRSGAPSARLSWHPFADPADDAQPDDPH